MINIYIFELVSECYVHVRHDVINVPVFERANQYFRNILLNVRDTKMLCEVTRASPLE